MTSDYNDLQILRAIKEDVSQPSIVKEIGFSVGKVNFILNALIEKGLIKTTRFLSSSNRMKYAYILTDDGIKEKISLTQKFIARKKTEYERMQEELKRYEGK